MLTNADITIYHLVEDEYIRTVYRGVSLHSKTKAVTENGGVRYDSMAVIRIPTPGAVEVDIGDYVFLGISEAVRPQKELCRVVLGFSDNRRGSGNMRHWRLDCK